MYLSICQIFQCFCTNCPTHSCFILYLLNSLFVLTWLETQCLSSFYLLLLQRLNDLLDTHLKIFDVVPLCLQQLLDDL